MSAGRGIVHSERSPQSDRDLGENRSAGRETTLHAIQTWVALPKENEETEPSFNATTAYAILRHNGVEIGKRDYLGQP